MVSAWEAYNLFKEIGQGDKEASSSSDTGKTHSLTKRSSASSQRPWVCVIKYYECFRNGNTLWLEGLRKDFTEQVKLKSKGQVEDLDWDKMNHFTRKEFNFWAT